jgi:hypothetical protein
MSDFNNVRTKPLSYFVLVTRSASGVQQKQLIPLAGCPFESANPRKSVASADFGGGNAQPKAASASKSAVLSLSLSLHKQRK